MSDLTAAFDSWISESRRVKERLQNRVEKELPVLRALALGKKFSVRVDRHRTVVGTIQDVALDSIRLSKTGGSFYAVFLVTLDRGAGIVGQYRVRRIPR